MTSILDDVDPQQHEAITHGEGPLLVVAGAGSGKTRVITRRIALLVERGVDPRGILALTFTNKAAREMRERVEGIVAAHDLWVHTFHGFAARVLRWYADRLGYTREYTIYDTEDQRKLVKSILKDLHIDDLRPAEVHSAISRQKNGMERGEQPGYRAERLGRALREYEERLRGANAMDFDDLLVNLRRLLVEDEEARERLQRRASWMLVDEYQDTNSIQFEILQRLVPEPFNVCATGDPDQSIYRWRGATIRNILDFERDFGGARVVTLDRNYRSTRSILDVANAVIRHNSDRYEKELRTENEQGRLVREIRARDDTDEAIAVGRTVEGWIGGGRGAGEIAVFYRVNAQSRLLERGLAERGIPYRIVGAVEFYRRREVKDVLAYVRVARNPRDEAAFLRIFNLPPRGLGKTTETRMMESARAEGVVPRELIRHAAARASFGGRARNALGTLAELLDSIDRLPPEDPAAFLEGVVELTMYREFLGAGTPHAERDRIENVNELVNAAAEYALREPSGGVDGFLEENALVSDQDAYDESAGAVSLMTVHSAKGLEFPCVAVTGLEEQLFPHALSIDTPAEVEEERRLFYVAATRAEKELVLTHAGRRLRNGVPMPSIPSRFLDEIPDEMLEVDDLADDPFEQIAEEEPVYRVESPAGGGFRAGDRVRHHHFGSGRVLAVRKAGGSTRITVAFDEAGRRELALEYANLQRA